MALTVGAVQNSNYLHLWALQRCLGGADQ